MALRIVAAGIDRPFARGRWTGIVDGRLRHGQGDGQGNEWKRQTSKQRAFQAHDVSPFSKGAVRLTPNAPFVEGAVRLRLTPLFCSTRAKKREEVSFLAPI